MKKILTTFETAAILGITDTRVRQLILAGKLPSRKFGRNHLIRAEDLSLVTERRSGRPALAELERKAA